MECITLPSKTWQWRFVLPKASGDIFKVSENNQIVAEATYDEGVFRCSFLFDYSDTPCTLSAKANAGDIVSNRYLEYRIELSVNDKISDEEWPYGNICVEHANFLFNLAEIEITSYTPDSECKTDRPTILGHFSHAEGWHPEENVWVGDCMPFSHHGLYHVFYLKDRHHHKSKWGKGAHQWAHISSEDLLNWNIHPMAIEIDKQEEALFVLVRLFSTTIVIIPFILYALWIILLLRFVVPYQRMAITLKKVRWSFI